MNEKNLHELGDLLRKWRLGHKHSSSYVAEFVERSATYYSRVETGKERPSKFVLEKITELYTLHAEDRQMIERLAGYATDTPSQGQDTAALAVKQSDGVTVKFDPDKLPILFTDIAFVTVSENGAVIDFGQRVVSTSEQHIVARVGLSLGHAERLHKLLGDQLAIARRRGFEN